MDTLIKLNKLKKIYKSGEIEVYALNNITLEIKKGEFIAIMGASGSGKSTMMNILGCLDVPTEGDYLFEDKNIKNFTENEFSDFRNEKIGFVFQSFNLLSRTSALENVELPLLYRRKKTKMNPQEKARNALIKVGLEKRLDHPPSKLSGGQQQRVAIARAMVNKPSIIMADEPTGNLDSKTSVEIMKLFQELNNEGITIILVTHEKDIAEYAKRNIVMSDGKIINDFSVKKRREASKEVEKL